MPRNSTLALLLLTATMAPATCIPIEEAPKRIGDTVCVTGKVLKAKQTESGTFFLDFCTNYRKCPFSVVVFSGNLRDVGDVRQLEGKVIEIHGRIQAWGKRSEIILKDARQLKGESGNLPPLPKGFDVERKGSFSPGDPPRKKKSRQ